MTRAGTGGPDRRRARRGAATLRVLLVLLIGTLAGCASGARADRPADRDTRNRAESGSLTTALRKLPGVLRVDGGYSRDASNPRGAVVLSITVGPGTDLGEVADQAVRSAWLSHLDPVTSMTVTVGPASNPAAAIDRHADFVFQRDQLTASYGPRPRSTS